MAIAAGELLDEGKCYACYGELSVAQIITLALDRRALLALDPDADVTPEGLITYAKCYLCFTQGNFFDLVELALLDKISQASV